MLLGSNVVRVKEYFGLDDFKVEGFQRKCC